MEKPTNNFEKWKEDELLPTIKEIPEQGWQREITQNIRSGKSLIKTLSDLNITITNAEKNIIIETTKERPLNIPKQYLIDLFQSASNEKEILQVKNILLPNTEPEAFSFDSLTSIEETPNPDKNPIEGLTRMYPDRVLISPTHQCMTYCQWCFRKKESKALGNTQLEKIFDYIGKDKRIFDVILTGGEPLLISDKRLESILEKLRKIEHVDIVRFHTRAPVVIPSRIDTNLLNILEKNKDIGKPIYVVTQIVHPLELRDQTVSAIHRLVEHGIPVFNQFPVLKGINDDQETFNDLMTKSIKYSVKPYYAIAPIAREGMNTRFFVPVEKVQELVNNYGRDHDGLGRPTVIVPVMGKKLTPEQLRDAQEKGIHLRHTKT